MFTSLKKRSRVEITIKSHLRLGVEVRIFGYERQEGTSIKFDFFVTRVHSEVSVRYK